MSTLSEHNNKNNSLKSLLCQQSGQQTSVRAEHSGAYGVVKGDLRGQESFAVSLYPEPLSLRSTQLDQTLSRAPGCPDAPGAPELSTQSTIEKHVTSSCDDFSNLFPAVPVAPLPSRDWIAWYRVVYPDDGIADPRPDLDAAFGDSLAWTQLLRYLWMQDGHDVDGLFGAFDGLRRLGACLVRRRVGAGLERGAIEAEEYAALRERYLVPRGGEVGKVLGRVAW